MSDQEVERTANEREGQSRDDKTTVEAHPEKSMPRAVVSVAFSRIDFDRVAGYARMRGMKTSEFIRQAALDQTEPQRIRVTTFALAGGLVTPDYTSGSSAARADIDIPSWTIAAR